MTTKTQIIKEKIIDSLEGVKEYQIFYKFSDVIEIIKAKSKEEAEEIADERINTQKHNLKKGTYCCAIEVEEFEE